MTTDMRIRTRQTANYAFDGGMTWQVASSAGDYATISVALRSLEEATVKAFQAFVDAVREVPTVEQVRAQTAGSYVHLVTYVSDSTLDQRYAIYEAQMKLYDLFPYLRLEFDLIDRKGYPVDGDELTGKLIEVIRELPDRSDDDEVS